MSTTTKYLQKFQFEITESQHRLISDVSPALGGDDAGPDPHQLLKMSLAACTAITLQMYAQRKKMNLTDVNVEVSILIEGKETQIQRRLHLEGELSAEEKQRLYEISNKCPIHRLLESQITIATEMF